MYLIQQCQKSFAALDHLCAVTFAVGPPLLMHLPDPKSAEGILSCVYMNHQDCEGRRKGIRPVKKASNDKWNRYEQALLVAMEIARWKSSTTTAEYQMLIIPTFHLPCCLRFVLADQYGELSFSLVQDHSSELFDAVWQEDAEAEVQAVRLIRQSCLEDITDLNIEQVATLRGHLALLEPMTLDPVDLAAQDGVSIRCDCYEQNRHHMFTLRSPTAQDTPRHIDLISVFLDAAQTHFHHPQIHDYLMSIRRYFR